MVEVSLLPRGCGLGEGNAVAASLQPPLSALDRSDCGLGGGDRGAKAGVPAAEGRGHGPRSAQTEHSPQDHRAVPRSTEESDSHTGPGPAEGSRAKKFCPLWEDMEGLKGENPWEQKDQKPLSRTPLESFVHLPESGLCHIYPERERKILKYSNIIQRLEADTVPEVPQCPPRRPRGLPGLSASAFSSGETNDGPEGRGPSKPTFTPKACVKGYAGLNSDL